MTAESIAELRAVIEAYNATGRSKPGILANWCNRVDFLVAWQARPPSADGRGVYIHLTPKTENPAHGRNDQP